MYIVKYKVMKFYNRTKELEKLNKIKEISLKQSSQFTLITGRRRIGKTELIKKHLKVHKEFLYFFVTKKTSNTLLTEYTETINKYFKQNIAFNNWDAFFNYLFKKSYKHKMTIVIDEFQEFELVDKSILSIIQKHWDTYQNKKRINFIVSGSYVSLINNLFYNKKQALYGRVTQKITLQQFTFKDTFKIIKDHDNNASIDTLLNFYSVYSGIPYYYKVLIDNGLIKNNIYKSTNELIINKDSTLNTEGFDILAREFGNKTSALYSILEAIAHKNNTFSKITNYTGLDQGYLSKNLNLLAKDFKIITKLEPIFANSQKVFKYKINDNFINFWFKYVYKNSSQIESGINSSVINKVKKGLGEKKGFAFENLCKEFLANQINKSNVVIDKIGSYFDKKGEIDLIIEKEDKNNPEFEIPARLKELYEAKDYGQYADADGKLRVNFLSNNDITGGNSGSPVINGNGELIGINFDRSWESTMSDVMFSEELCRNITVDIRYVLFVIDKYAGATHLIKEMNLVGAPTIDGNKSPKNDNLEQINKEIKTAPKKASLYFKRGEEYYNQGKLIEAREDFKTALSIEPSNSDYSKRLKFMNSFIQQIEAIDKVEQAQQVPK